MLNKIWESKLKLFLCGHEDIQVSGVLSPLIRNLEYTLRLVVGFTSRADLSAGKQQTLFIGREAGLIEGGLEI